MKKLYYFYTTWRMEKGHRKTCGATRRKNQSHFHARKIGLWSRQRATKREVGSVEEGTFCPRREGKTAAVQAHSVSLLAG